MSRFDDEVREDLPGIFADAGDLADYQGAAVAASGILAILDRNFEAHDDDQVALRITTVSVRVAEVPSSSRGDQIDIAGRTWAVQEILEDDGHIRRLYVT